MSIRIRPYSNGGWEVDIRITLPDGIVIRERKKAPFSSKSAALRWAEGRERVLFVDGKPKTPIEQLTPKVPTLKEFSPRFLEGYAQANRQKPSGIAAKETILRVHLIPQLGDKSLDAITTEDVQQLKSSLRGKAPKTVNNVLTVLSVVLKMAVEWGVITRVACLIKLVQAPKPTAEFHDFADYERLVKVSSGDGQQSHLVVLLGGEAGLRCGEIMALEWRDIDLTQRQLTVARSEWKGQVTAPKSGRARHVPMTNRLTEALRAGRNLRSARVVSDEQGKPMTQKMVQRLVRRAARRANMKAGVHILRHTFCSHLAMRGAPARAIQELAGHRELSTTQRYMHLSPAALASAIRLLDGPTPEQVRGDMLEAAGNRA